MPPIEIAVGVCRNRAKNAKAPREWGDATPTTYTSNKEIESGEGWPLREVIVKLPSPRRFHRIEFFTNCTPEYDGMYLCEFSVTGVVARGMLCTVPGESCPLAERTRNGTDIACIQLQRAWQQPHAAVRHG